MLLNYYLKPLWDIFTTQPLNTYGYLAIEAERTIAK